MKELVVLSGKGGTGKTSVTAALAHLAHQDDLRWLIADADVDAANLGLLLGASMTTSQPFVGGSVAEIDNDLCAGCGECAEACRFDAIAEKNGVWTVDPIDCEGCGACVDRCPAAAIELAPETVGECRVSQTGYGPLQHAHLFPGHENSGKLVTAVKRCAQGQAQVENRPVILIDGPPGTGCSVISAVSGATLGLVVVEPSVSGQHDMERALATLAHFGVPAVVCVNKADLYPDGVLAISRVAAAQGVPTIARLPFDLAMTEALAKGRPVTAAYPQAPVSLALLELWRQVKVRMAAQPLRA